MNPEAVAIVGVGVTLLAVMVPLQLSIARRIDRLEDRLNERMDRMDGRMDRMNGRMDRRIDGRMERLEARIEELVRDLRAMAERVARIEGAVCGPWRPPEPDPSQGDPA